jgi:diguanylate cyclase (GGDEF)-like protein
VIEDVLRAVASAFPAERAEAMLDAIERAFRMSNAPRDSSPECVLCGGYGVPRYPLLLQPSAAGHLHLGPVVPYHGMRAFSEHTPGMSLACLDCLTIARHEHSAAPPSASAERLLHDALRAVRASGAEQAEAAALALEAALTRAGGPVLSREFHPGCFLCGETRPCAQGKARAALCADCSQAHWRMIATDGLTGAATRSVFVARLDAAVARARALSTPLVLLSLDIDYMKAWNDFYGFMAGDTLLTRVPGILRSALAERDFVARYGGEEFSAFLEGRTLAEGVEIAERIRARAWDALRPPEIERDPNESRRAGLSGRPYFPEGHVTVSIGVARFEPDMNLGDLLRAAEDRLLDAKVAGRNRVVA